MDIRAHAPGDVFLSVMDARPQGRVRPDAASLVRSFTALREDLERLVNRPAPEPPVRNQVDDLFCLCVGEAAYDASLLLLSIGLRPTRSALLTSAMGNCADILSDFIEFCSPDRPTLRSMADLALTYARLDNMRLLASCGAMPSRRALTAAISGPHASMETEVIVRNREAVLCAINELRAHEMMLTSERRRLLATARSRYETEIAAALV